MADEGMSLPYHDWHSTDVSDERRAVAIRTVCAHGRRVCERERERTLAQLELTERERRAVSQLAERLTLAVLSAPVSRLTDPATDRTFVRTAEQLFSTDERTSLD